VHTNATTTSPEIGHAEANGGIEMNCLIDAPPLFVARSNSGD